MSDCFDHMADAWDDCLFGMSAQDYEWGGRQPGRRWRAPTCRTCGSTEVRWRQQGGKWVLFSLEPGKLHECDLADEFK